MGAEDGRFVAIGDAGDVRLDILVSDDGHGFFEGGSVGGGEAVAAEVLHVSIDGEDFGEDTLLDLVGVGGDFFDELNGLVVLLYNAAVVVCGFLWSLRHSYASSSFSFFTVKIKMTTVCFRERERVRRKNIIV